MKNHAGQSGTASEGIRANRPLPAPSRGGFTFDTAAVSRALCSVEALTLCAVAMIGLLQLPAPFWGDQALFALGAQSIHDGAVLYRDFWDLKQPGIYWFFTVAGSLFAFDAAGIHLFELFYQLTFCAVLIATLRQRFAEPGWACLAALFTVGMYYAIVNGWHLTQVESLVGFPLYLALWFAIAAARAPRARHALFMAGVAGAAGAVVVVFKFVLLPLVVAACWLPGAGTLRRSRARSATVLRLAAACACGFVGPLLAVAAYFAAHHALGIAWQTTFDIPGRIVATFPHQSVSVLRQTVRWFGLNFAPVGLLAIVGAIAALRSKRDPLVSGLLLWIGLGIAVILAQRESWWSYQALLIVPPLGILAAGGVDALWQAASSRGWSPRRKRVAFGLAAVVLFVVPLSAVAQRTAALAKYGFALQAAQRERYRQAISVSYAAAYSSSRYLLQAQRSAGDIFVSGDPLIYTVAGRRQAVALNGWAVTLLLPDQWTRLAAQLSAARPPYIFVSSAADNGPALIAQRSPEVARFIATGYRAVWRGDDGTWYARRAGGAHSLAP